MDGLTTDKSTTTAPQMTKNCLPFDLSEPFDSDEGLEVEAALSLTWSAKRTRYCLLARGCCAAADGRCGRRRGEAEIVAPSSNLLKKEGKLMYLQTRIPNSTYSKKRAHS